MLLSEFCLAKQYFFNLDGLYLEALFIKTPKIYYCMSIRHHSSSQIKQPLMFVLRLFCLLLVPPCTKQAGKNRKLLKTDYQISDLQISSWCKRIWLYMAVFFRLENEEITTCPQD